MRSFRLWTNRNKMSLVMRHLPTNMGKQQALHWPRYHHLQSQCPPLLIIPPLIHLSRTWCRIPPCSISLIFPVPVACQHNFDKSSDSLCENKYHSRPHTTPEKRGEIKKGNPPPENQQAPQLSQENNNGKNTKSSYLLYSSIAAAVLWQLLIKNPFFNR